MPETLGLRSDALAGFLVGAARRGRFGGLATPHSGHAAEPFAASRWEYEDRHSFFEITGCSVEALRGKRLLDLGCGYGGRTVFYAASGAEAFGIDPHEPAIESARAFAADSGVEADFKVGRGEDLPFEDSSFDLVLSFDVLEHVQDPAAVFGEIARVTRPGGEIWLVFPSYLGARSAHLDFVSRLPGLHRVFAAEVLAEAANRVAQQRGLTIRAHPAKGPFGRVTVTDMLNGMSSREAANLLASIPVDWEIRYEPIIEPRSKLPLGRQASALLSRMGARLPELLVGRIVALGMRR